MSKSGGDILCQQAYAQGKMLNHSAWGKVLPRGITPSDIDFFFDNMGWVIFGELSSSTFNWWELEPGQRWGYWNIIRGTHHIAVLCKHSVPPTRKIDTYHDIEAFSVMYDCNGKLTTRRYNKSEAWRNLVDGWFNKSPQWVREKLPPPIPEDKEVDWSNVLIRERDERDDFLKDALDTFGGEVVEIV